MDDSLFLSMNIYLQRFLNKFDKPGKALDLGAGDCLKQLGWICDGVDLNTGVDLNKLYIGNKQYDLVFSNYVIQRLDSKDVLVSSAYRNLKEGGWFFLHTFDKSDKSAKGFDKDCIVNLLKDGGLIDVKAKIFSFYDNEHQHWHKVIEVIGRKPSKLPS